MAKQPMFKVGDTVTVFKGVFPWAVTRVSMRDAVGELTLEHHGENIFFDEVTGVGVNGGRMPAYSIVHTVPAHYEAIEREQAVTVITGCLETLPKIPIKNLRRILDIIGGIADEYCDLFDVGDKVTILVEDAPVAITTISSTPTMDKCLVADERYSNRAFCRTSGFNHGGMGRLDPRIAHFEPQDEAIMEENELRSYLRSRNIARFSVTNMTVPDMREMKKMLEKYT